MEAIKPLIVLVLFGTILYGAYSVVQKGPSTPAVPQASAPEAPPFAPPAVEVPQTQPPPVMPTPLQAQATPPAAVPAPPAPPPAAALAAAVPPAFVTPAPATAPPATLPEAAPLAATAAAAATVAAQTARGGEAIPAPASNGPPTYLAAESARPPAQDDVATASGAGDDRPDRLASAASATLPNALPPEMPPPPGTLPSSAAFATAWAKAHDDLAAGRYAAALTSLSVWYDDRSLSLEESHRLEDLLGQLAGSVIYSTDDLLRPPHIVAPRETLPAIAAPLGVSWQLLAKINGIDDPMRLVPGEHLKVVSGPFDAVVSVARRRLSLQVGGAYAGSFPVVVGRDFLPRVGSSLPVAETRQVPSGQAIVLADGLAIQAADDPSLLSDDTAPTSLVVSARDFADLVDILIPGSRVLVRQ